MSDFLQQMATGSAERAANAAPIGPGDLDKPVVPLRLGVFDIIAELGIDAKESVTLGENCGQPTLGKVLYTAHRIAATPRAIEHVGITICCDNMECQIGKLRSDR